MGLICAASSSADNSPSGHRVRSGSPSESGRPSSTPPEPRCPARGSRLSGALRYPADLRVPCCRCTAGYSDCNHSSYPLSRNTAAIREYFLNLDLFVERVHDFMEVLCPEPVLVPVLHEALAGIDHENSFAVGCVLLVHDNNACRNSRAVKEIRGQTDDSLDNSFLNQVTRISLRCCPGREHRGACLLRPFRVLFMDVRTWRR